MGEWLQRAGVPVDVRRPYRGEPLPQDLADHAGMVVLGGSMSAYDDAEHPWLTEVKELVVAAVDSSTPTLGVCLGHQLITVALGGSVRVNPRGQQIGVLPVGWVADAREDRLFGALGEVPAVQWNNDVVDELPAGAVALAATEHGEVQAARFAPSVWGVQWHPEAGTQIVRAWADNDRDHCLERGVDVDEYVDQVAAAQTALKVAGESLTTSFVGVVRAAVPAP